MIKISFKKSIIIVIICLMVVFLGTLSVLAVEPRLILRVSDVNTEDYCYHHGLVSWSEAVDKASNGEIKIEVYSSGALGGAIDSFENVQMGAIDFCLVNSGILPTVMPEIGIVNLPYIFKDLAHFYRVCDGGLLAKIKDNVEKQNLDFLILSAVSGGARSFFVKKPVYKLADLKNKKIRVMQNDIYINMVELCGAKATPMAYADVYIALQTGVIDGAEVDIGGYYTQKFNEACPYYILDEHTLDITFLVGSTKTWNKLSVADKKILIDALPAFVEGNSKYEEQSRASTITQLKKLGVTFIDVDKEEFKKAVMPLWKTTTDKYGSELFDIITAIE
jgi:tripartite ATP-independent transporter DctP family solute receptor